MLRLIFLHLREKTTSSFFTDGGRLNSRSETFKKSDCRRALSPEPFAARLALAPASSNVPPPHTFFFVTAKQKRQPVPIAYSEAFRGLHEAGADAVRVKCFVLAEQIGVV